MRRLAAVSVAALLCASCSSGDGDQEPPPMPTVTSAPAPERSEASVDEATTTTFVDEPTRALDDLVDVIAGVSVGSVNCGVTVWKPRNRPGASTMHPSTDGFECIIAAAGSGTLASYAMVTWGDSWRSAVVERYRVNGSDSIVPLSYERTEVSDDDSGKPTESSPCARFERRGEYLDCIP